MLAFNPDGGAMRVFATGLRNCSGLGVQPQTAALWCVVNERDDLGDDLPPDFATTVGDGKFYGWPWYYIGDHEQPRHAGERPDLKGQVTVPDVLLQPHSAPLGIAFYTSSHFPQKYRDERLRRDARLVEPGQAHRLQGGAAGVRQRPADRRIRGFPDRLRHRGRRRLGPALGVTVTKSGDLLVSDDLGGVIWRVRYTRRRADRALKPATMGSARQQGAPVAVALAAAVLRRLIGDLAVMLAIGRAAIHGEPQ